VAAVKSALDEGSAQALSAGLGEQPWLRDRRMHAWDAFRSLPMPNRSDEYWQHTDVGALDLESFSLAESDRAAPTLDVVPRGIAGAAADPEQAQGTLIEWNGRVIHQPVSPECAERGVVFEDLASAAESHGDLVRKYFMTDAVQPHESKFAALHGAFFSGGVFLYVPERCRVSIPLRAIHGLSGKGLAIFPHTLIVAGPDSEVSFIDEYTGGDGEGLCCAVTEVFVGAGARVAYASLQGFDPGVWHFSCQKTLQQRDSGFRSLAVALGGRLSRLEVQSLLLGQGSSSRMLGLYFGGAGQHFDSRTLQSHVAPNTSSNLLYKGALKQNGRAVFSGYIKVKKEAQKTDAYQANRNLLLDEQARVDTIPNLEIEADDVRCSHGAAVGRVDPEHLFYLMSRGISERHAERLLVFGFLQDVMEEIEHEGVRAELQQAIEAKIGRM
jgi:Fe-S cluster assembly protein SufD